jgi:GNAT superfamily N-acetyltransferase
MKELKHEMKIRLAKVEDLDQVLKVLNDVTLYLQKKGINQWSYPWSHEIIGNEIKNDHCYVLLLGERVIGTFFISNIDHLSELSIEPQSKYLSKIAILPEFQGNNLGSKIIDFACSFTQGLNKTLYLDCWAGNEKLKEFYSNNGLEYVGDFPEEDYFISIFKFS